MFYRLSIESLDAYFVANKELPTKIVLFRDGVGEGQIDYVKSYEVQEVIVSIFFFSKNEYCCKIIMIKKYSKLSKFSYFALYGNIFEN